MNMYIGLDVSKQSTDFCVLDDAGQLVCRGKAATDPVSLAGALAEQGVTSGQLVLETGRQCHWLASGLCDLGYQAQIIDARAAHALLKLSRNKTDSGDAWHLARLARSGDFQPVSIRSAASREMRRLHAARRQLVAMRRDVDNCLRGLLGSEGLTLPPGAGTLPRRVKALLAQHPQMAVFARPMLTARAALTDQITALSARIEEAAKACRQARLLMTIPGVGAQTATALVAAIDGPERFADSRAVGAYFGLTPRRWQSGQVDVSGRISRMGDGQMRSLLYSAANSLLSVYKQPHPLKDWARRLKRKNGHRSAVTALARKLAVIVHCMLSTGETFRTA